MVSFFKNGVTLWSTNLDELDARLNYDWLAFFEFILPEPYLEKL
jgi:hypothetical protein